MPNLLETYVEAVRNDTHMEQDYKGHHIAVKKGKTDKEIRVWIDGIDFTRNDSPIESVGGGWREGKRIVDEIISDKEHEDKAHLAFARKHLK